MRAPDKSEIALKKRISSFLEADRARLALRQPFIGAMLMRLNLVVVVDSRLKLSVNDGASIFMNAEAIARLTEPQRFWLLAHEAWHIVFLHALRRDSRDFDRWWRAADLEVFFALSQDKFRHMIIPPYQPEWRSLNAESIYLLLKARPSPHSQPGETHQGLPSSRLEGHSDGHGKVDENVSIPGEEVGDSLHLEPKIGLPEPQDLPGQEAVCDDDFSPFFDQHQEEKCREMVVQAVQMLERYQGKLPAHLQRLYKDYSRPKLNWKEILAQFITTSYHGTRRWLPPNRRYLHQGLYLQSHRSEQVKGVVAVDTSGSMVNELDLVLGEVVGLMKSFGHFEITVIQCDAKIQSIDKYEDPTMIPVDGFTATGLGGTDFRPVFDHLAEQQSSPVFLVYLTDGYGMAPQFSPPFPVLWILTNGGQAPAAWGLQVFMPKQDN